MSDDGADFLLNSQSRSQSDENFADSLFNADFFSSQQNLLDTTLTSSFHGLQDKEAVTVVSAGNSTESRQKFLILRTFAAVDFQNLVSGFESWDEYSPCKDHDQVEMQVDILLFFSSSWSQWPAAKEAAEYVSDMFSNNSCTWAHCFNNLYLGSAFIEDGEDMYSPTLMGIHEKWVNGPNRQFERALRAAGSRGYELVYFMEVDSTPVRFNWLSSLITEIKLKKPFAVLGR